MFPALFLPVVHHCLYNFHVSRTWRYSYTLPHQVGEQVVPLQLLPSEQLMCWWRVCDESWYGLLKEELSFSYSVYIDKDVCLVKIYYSLDIIPSVFSIDVVSLIALYNYHFHTCLLFLGGGVMTCHSGLLWGWFGETIIFALFCTFRRILKNV